MIFVEADVADDSAVKTSWGRQCRPTVASTAR